MGSLSDYAETKMLDHLLKNAAWGVESNLYIGLATATIQDASIGGDITECGGDDYARVVMNTWTSAATRLVTNNSIVTFAEAGTQGAWGEITDWFISDSDVEGAGNIIAYGAFDDPKTVGTGDDASIAIGALTISVDTYGMSDYCAHAVLDHLFSFVTFTQSTSLYVGLATGAIEDGDDGAACDEASGGAYAREQCDGWNAASAGTCASENTAAIIFTQATDSWGEVTDVFISPTSVSDAGEILFYTAVTTAKTVGTGDTVQFDADTLTISLD